MAGGIRVLQPLVRAGTATASGRRVAQADPGDPAVARTPTAGSIDSQSVKATDTVGAATRGFDGGKKINGRKRHIAVDTLGLLLAVIFTPASVQDRDGALNLLTLPTVRFTRIKLVWADGGYASRLVLWAKAVLPPSAKAA